MRLKLFLGTIFVFAMVFCSENSEKKEDIFHSEIIDTSFEEKDDTQTTETNEISDEFSDELAEKDKVEETFYEPVQEVTFENSDLTLKISSGPFRMELLHKEETVLVIDEFGAGKVKYDPETNYDPYWLFRSINPQGEPITHEGLNWFKISEVVKNSKDQTLYLKLENKKIFTLQVSNEFSDCFKIKISMLEENNDYQYIYFSHPFHNENSDKEYFYGMGEVFDSVTHNGKLRAMQFEPYLEIESANNEAHVPVPFYISTRGYAVFVDEYTPQIFDFGTIKENRVSYYNNNNEITFYLMFKEKPVLNLETLKNITGAPQIPDYWAFAPHQWRNEISGQNEVLKDAYDMRTNLFPCGVIWIDRPWQEAYNTFTFDKEKYQNPEAMIKELNDMGFNVVVWSSPYMSEEGDKWQEIVEKDLLVSGPDDWPHKLGYLVDLTSDEAQKIWINLVNRTTDIGVSGFKLDYGEDIQVGLLKKRFKFSFKNGEDERTMHHKFSNYYHEPYNVSLNNHGKKGFIISRTGVQGGQTKTSCIWPGDLDNDFRKFGEDHGVGGLPSAIIGGLSLAASLYPVYGSDTGGFRHGRPEKTVLIRWAQYSSLSPIMQIGGGGVNHNPWDFEKYGDEPVYDEETLEIVREYAKLHIRLFPYNYTLAKISEKKGLPIMYPWGLLYPDDGRAPDFQYFFGEWLLVAPVIDETSKVSVMFPAQKFVNFFDGTPQSGPDSVEFEVPLSKIPLFIKQNGIIPLLRPTVQTLSPVKDTSIDSFSTNKNPLYIYAVPYSQANFTLYDGTQIKMSYNESEKNVTIKIQGGSDFQEFKIKVYKSLIPQMQGVNVSDSEKDYEKKSGETYPDCEACFSETEKFIHINPKSNANPEITISW